MSVQYSTRLPCGNRVLDLAQPQVMGILNVTPDSFSDGGRFRQRDEALRHAAAMVAAGASLIDVGGESTRPGALQVSADEELQRVAPVVEAIAAELDVIISVDTSCPQVMRESARLGAGLINDVRSLRREGALQAAAESGLPVCLMHMQGEPETMQKTPITMICSLKFRLSLLSAWPRARRRALPLSGSFWIQASALLKICSTT